MPVRRFLLVLVFLLGAAMGCGGNSDQPTVADPSGQAPNPAEANSTQTGPTSATGAHNNTAEPAPEAGGGNEPAPEENGPEKPAPKVDQPYAKFATAPVGSNDNSTGPAKKPYCVGVSLLRDPPQGLTVKVTGVKVDHPELMGLKRGSCKGWPSCHNYRFSSENSKCSLFATPSRTDPDGLLPETRLTLSGKAYCAAGAEHACAEWVRDVNKINDKYIKLFLPSDPEPATSRSADG